MGAKDRQGGSRMRRNFAFLLLVATLVFSIFFASMPHIFALLGPIHVELNIMGDSPSSVRAGQVNAFKIHIKFNVNIRVHDWVKVWFPIDEASCKLEDICDGMPKITGAKEHPRFVPNEEYFKKYNNEEEAKIGKLYEALDDRRGKTSFEKCECEDGAPPYSNCAPEGNCRIIADPSGLGCWMTGTVMPALPRDEKKRYTFLYSIMEYVAIGYDCGCGRSMPIIINTHKERSLQINSPLEVEAWRKGYNPIDFNTGKGANIFAPMTPGRYRLSVATAPEPTPVESEYFVFPCSQISRPVVTLAGSDPGEPSDIAMKFNVGDGGALDKGKSKIWVRFPEGFVFPEAIDARHVKINGDVLEVGPKIDNQSHTIEITCPVNINNSGEVSIAFSPEAGIKNPAKRTEATLTVWTDSEPEKVESLPFVVEIKPRVEVKPNIFSNIAEYYAVALLSDGPIKAGQEFKIIFPDGTLLPETIASSSIVLNGRKYDGKTLVGWQTVSLRAYFDIVDALKIRFLKTAGIRNPLPGEYELSYEVDGKGYAFPKYTISDRHEVFDLMLSDYQGCERSGYKFTYIPSYKGDLEPGDGLTVEFPLDTSIPKEIPNDAVLVGDKPSRSVSVDGLKLTITTDTAIKTADGGAVVDITLGAGIINTRYSGKYNLKIWTGKDEPVLSPEFVVTMPRVESWLEFKDPAQPDGLEYGGCLWYKTPPMLSITSCNPLAKIFIWFDNKTDSIIQYTGEKRLSPASQRTTIWYYAQVGDIKEEPKSMYLCLDTVLPRFSIIQPNKQVATTNKKNYTVKGERETCEMLTDGDNEKYMAVDGIYVNGKELLTAEIFETVNRDDIKMTYETTIDLKEGSNVVEIKGIDQAGNVKIEKRTIILDTIPPAIEIVRPDPKELQKPGENIAIWVKSETDASVFIDGQIAQKVEELPDEKTAIFEAGWDVVKGENKVKILSTDAAGNTAVAYLTFMGGTKAVTIELWIGKTDFVVNGEKMPNLATAPTASSPPLPKAFAGNTFMPIADIAKALGAEVSWDAKEKMVVLTQTLDNETKKVIQLWIGKKQARINGKDVWIDAKKVLYPTIVSGKTLLPLRFIAENLSCDIVYDAKTKKITLTHPKP